MSIRITALYERLSRNDEILGENDFTPFLNIMNEWYAKDTSKKIRTRNEMPCQKDLFLSVILCQLPQTEGSQRRAEGTGKADDD